MVSFPLAVSLSSAAPRSAARGIWSVKQLDLVHPQRIGQICAYVLEVTTKKGVQGPDMSNRRLDQVSGKWGEELNLYWSSRPLV